MVIGIGAGVFPGSRSSVFGETRDANTQASHIAVLQQASERSGLSNRTADPLLSAFVEPVSKAESSSDLVSRKDLKTRQDLFNRQDLFKSELRKAESEKAETLNSASSSAKSQISSREKETGISVYSDSGGVARSLFEPSVRDVQIAREAEQNRTQAKLELSKLRQEQSKEKSDALKESKRKEKVVSSKEKEENGQHTEGIEPPAVSQGQLLLAQTAYQKARMREAVLQQSLNSQNKVSVVI